MMFIATVVTMAIVSSPHWSIESSNAICVRHLLQDISVFPVIFLLKSSSVWTRFQLFPVLGVLGFSKLSVHRVLVFSCYTGFMFHLFVFEGFISMEFIMYTEFELFCVHTYLIEVVEKIGTSN
jgi:hypothetical protein